MPSGTLIINGGALDSTARTVTLGLSASDSLSGVSQAAYSDDGSSWSTWESYSPLKSWSLETGDGPKAVYARFRDAAGNVSDAISDTIRLDTSVSPAYGFYINEDALFTSQVTVTLSLPALPNTAQMMVSNGGGFFGAQWESYSAYKPWAITQYGSYVIPRTVYVKYKDVNGNVSATYQDDIILDLNAPSGSVSIEGTSQGSSIEAVGAAREPPLQSTMPHAAVRGGDAQPLPRSPLSVNGEGVGGEVSNVALRLSASDDVSGVGGMMVSNSPAYSGASWETFSSTRQWSVDTGGKVYVAFKDNAGNASPIYAAALSGAKESLPSLALGTVHPKTGGTVASGETGTSVAFPSGAVQAKAEVTLVPAVEAAQEQSTGSLRSTGKFLTLTAKTGETSITTVSKPYTITVGYMAGDIVGMDEATLGIYWWNGSAWQKEATSRVDTAARTVNATLSHLSAFALLGESSTRTVYLPVVLKTYSAGW
ncbi:MAG TPA: hypothetical protein ACFYED_12150 [Candidatus Tripitaka californicus]|uniref:hypothetical protein n=1 Tax=Candidatus Tripitaka californicus TaxID=3367616 RepID=UPI004025467A